MTLAALGASPSGAASSKAPAASDPSLGDKLQAAQAKVSQLNTEIAQSTARLDQLNQTLDADQQREADLQVRMAALARLEYQQPTLTLSNVLGAPNLDDLLGRVAMSRAVVGKQQAMIDEMDTLRQRDQRARDDVAKQIAEMRNQRAQAAQATENALGIRTQVAGTLLSKAKPGDPFAGACHPTVAQGFGPTTFGLEPTLLGFSHFHTGIDFDCPEGTPIHSVTDGIAHVTYGWGDGFGNNVVVETSGQPGSPGTPGTYFVRYGHMLPNLAVADGATVHAGDVIGYEGSTGASSGPHLHFEADVGSSDITNCVDPSVLLSIG